MSTALLVTVTESSAEAGANFSRLVASLAKQEVEILHIVVRRGGASPNQAEEGSTTSPGGYVRVDVDAPYRISLSAARNLAIASEGYRSSLGRADVVGFPDDDCEYPAGLVRGVIAALDSGSQFVSVPYGPSRTAINRRRFPARDEAISFSQVMRYTSSNTFFLRPEVARHLAAFDESFGLGAELGSSEDSEFLFRAVLGGFHGRYLGKSELLSLHPYKDHRPAEYYRGNLAVLARYARRSPLVAGLLLRRLLGGVAGMVRGRLPAKEFLLALRMTVEMVRQPGGTG